MNSNLLPTQRLALLAVFNPQDNAAATLVTAWLDMGKFGALLAELKTGVLAATSTVDAKFEQALDSIGTGAKDVPNTDITQLTQAGGDADKQVRVNLNDEQLDATNDFRFARFSVTVAVANAFLALSVYGTEPRYAPASDDDVATVAEIV